MKKIDIHCHTTNRLVNDVIHPDASMGVISSLMDTYDIEYTVLLASYFPHKQSGISNFRLLNWIKEAESGYISNFLMFGSLDFEHYFYQGLNELEELATKYREYMYGIKIYTCYQDINITSKKFTEVMELARKFNLPVMFHAGVSYAAYRKYGKKTIARMYGATELRVVAKMYPEINFIFSHLSKPDFNQMVMVAKECPNVYSDVSGLIDSKYNMREITDCIRRVKTFVNECGPEKLLFGTDFPVQSHVHSVYFVERGMEGFSSDDKQLVYSENARRILGLP